MKVIWLDRDGYTEKTESMTPKQAMDKIGPLLKPWKVNNAAPALRPQRYCAAINLKAGTLTVYARGGAWCRENKGQCRGNGCV